MAMNKTSIYVILLTLLLGTPAIAQKKSKRTNINFEDQLVEGEFKKPELFYLLQKKQFNFGKLIKLRENFIPELRKTNELVERGREP